MKHTIMNSRLIIFFYLALFIASCDHERNNLLDPEYHYTVTDIDGNIYHPVVIGKQVWMIENLKTTRYRNGDPIPNVTENTEWVGLNTGAYCWMNNDVSQKDFSGALYNWYAINDSRKIAPNGWHIPSPSEWDTLVAYLGGIDVAGSKLLDSLNWDHYAGTNESGFTAVPGGIRGYNDGIFFYAPYSFWWGLTNEIYYTYDNSFILADAYCFYISFGDAGKNRQLKNSGLSVRCIRDNISNQ